MLQHSLLLAAGEALCPLGGRAGRVDALFANLVASGVYAGMGPAPKGGILEGVRDGERWEVLCGGWGPGVVLLIALVAGGGGGAGGGRKAGGLGMWRGKEVSWGDLGAAVGWAGERDPGRVAWARTWGAVLVRGLMGVFDVEGGVGVGGRVGVQGVQGVQEEEVREVVAWRGRVVALCNSMPRRAAAGEEDGWPVEGAEE